MRFQYVLSEIATGLRRNVTMTIAVVITVAISISMLGAGMLIDRQAEITGGFWRDKIEVSVYMCNDFGVGEVCADGKVTDAQRSAIEQTLEEHKDVETVYFESQDEAYEHLKEEFSESLGETVTPELLQESFRVALTDPEKPDSLKSAVSGLPGVASVTDQEELFGGLFKVLDGFRTGAIVVAALQIIAAILLIANTIRLAAYNRRRETGIMRLVGASSFYIQLPFILEAAFAGLIGSIFGVLTVVGLEEFIVQRLLAPNFKAMSSVWVDFGDVVGLVPQLLAIGVAISAIASFVTLRRYLRV